MNSEIARGLRLIDAFGSDLPADVRDAMKELYGRGLMEVRFKSTIDESTGEYVLEPEFRLRGEGGANDEVRRLDGHG